MHAQNLVDSVIYDIDRSIPSFILSPKRSAVAVFSQRSSQHLIHEAENVLVENLNLDANISLELKDVGKDPNENYHISFAQYYKGIEIEGTRYNVHYVGDSIVSINGNFRTIKNLSVMPSISEQAALQYALSYIHAEQYMWESVENESWIKAEQGDSTATFYPTAKLVIFFKEDLPLLTYKFDIYSYIPFDRQYVYVNAINGSVEGTQPRMYQANGVAMTRYSGQRNIVTESVSGGFRLQNNENATKIKTFDLRGKNSYASAIDYVDNDNNWTAQEWNNSNKDNAALDAHWGAQMTYDYFKTAFNRYSYDNRNSPLLGYVNADLSYFTGETRDDNAFWDGQRMTYGAGTLWEPMTALDVTAHEIGHGVNTSTANLVYSYESGALNEGFSDIWAACVENYAKPGQGIWTIGEDVASTPLRYMNNPKQGGQPDTYLGTNWATGTADHGGVHTNSGVINYWFYLLSVGGSGTNDKNQTYSVAPLGIEKAAKIAYTTLTLYLNSNSNYTQARDLSITAARQLFGYGDKQGTSYEELQVANAWYAVGVGNKPGLSISGPSVACSNETLVYRVGTPGTGYTWNISGGLQILSGQGTDQLTVKVLSGTGEKCNINVSKGGQSAQKVVYRGIPTISTINGPTTARTGSSVIFSASPVVDTDGLFIPYKWFVVGGTGSHISGSGQSCEITFSNSGTYTVMCQGQSPCGNQGTGASLTVRVAEYYYTLSSIGPSVFQLQPENETTVNDKSLLVKYELFTEGSGILAVSGQVYKQGGTLDFSNLSKGIYLLRIQIGESAYETHKIILK